MLSTNVRNSILEALYGRFGESGRPIIPTSDRCYLGFSTALTATDATV